MAATECRPFVFSLWAYNEGYSFSVIFKVNNWYMVCKIGMKIVMVTKTHFLWKNHIEKLTVKEPVQNVFV